MIQPAVAIRQVHKSFGPVRALDGVDFRVERGEFFGLLGPNGAGKSTLINAMAGLVRTDRGRIEITGFDVVRDYRRSRRALGVVPQELVYDPFFSVREVLHWQSGYFGLRADNEAWIDELLAALGLADKAGANLAQLSGGMKRRVLIAQALVHRPQVVVLDEPTAGVDVELRRMLWRFAGELHRQGHTIVLTTHYLEEAEALCGRIAILNDGRLQALDEKRALLARHPYRFLRLRSEPDTHLPEGVAGLEWARDGDWITLRLHKAADEVGSVLKALHDAGVPIHDLRTEEPGLEEVFLELTKGEVESTESGVER
jgi:ABC-2 type transport system ATP-binding protein